MVLWALRFLQFDTDLFGIKTGVLDRCSTEDGLPLVDAVASAREQGLKLLYVSLEKADELEISFMVEHNINYVDDKVTFHRSVADATTSTQPTSGLIVERVDATSPQLEELAIASGHASRFFADSNISREAAKELFRRWMQNSIKGLAAKDVFAAKDDVGFVVGMITLRVVGEHGDIGLIAVDPSRRNGGIGQTLLQKSFEWARENSLTTMTVVTQRANEGACRFYKKNGFEEMGHVFVYHVWL
jgi:dTDP-4-amino-4,6-dideoxy-D-galactose acyltransferase